MKLHSFRRLGYGFGVVLLLAAGSLQAADPAGTGSNPKPDQALTIALAKLPTGAKPVELVLIPAGSFRMGCELTERGRVGREFHPHEVTITRPFYFGRYEVTQAQWWAVMGTRPARAYGEGDDHPVYHVTWNECQEFIARLKAREQGRFRLPTEAEWEYVCRAGTQTRFWFGDALDCSDIREFCEQLDAYMWWGGSNIGAGIFLFLSAPVRVIRSQPIRLSVQPVKVRRW